MRIKDFFNQYLDVSQENKEIAEFNEYLDQHIDEEWWRDMNNNHEFIERETEKGGRYEWK